MIAFSGITQFFTELFSDSQPTETVVDGVTGEVVEQPAPTVASSIKKEYAIAAVVILALLFLFFKGKKA